MSCKLDTEEIYYQNSLNKKITKVGGGTDAETLDKIGSKVSGTAKKGYLVRTYVIKTKPILKVYIKT